MKANKIFAVALAALTLGFVACNQNNPTPGPEPVEFSINKTELTMNVGETFELVVNMDATWSSSNTEVATVQQGAMIGTVKALKAGEAVITATTADNKTATCKVTVKEGTTPPATADISVTDNSVEDWLAIPEEKLAKSDCPEDAAYLGLKGVAVYANELYINILIEYDPEEIPDHTSVPFHVYINTDNSDETGGYGDQWTDANVDIMMEGFLYSAAEWDGDTPLDEGDICDYDPVVVPWTGEVGGSGWGWGAALDPAAPFVQSQHVGGKYVEFKMMRELIPTLVGWNEEEFGIGFDIQQSWESVGILPLISPEEGNTAGHTNKLQVKIYK